MIGQSKKTLPKQCDWVSVRHLRSWAFRGIKASRSSRSSRSQLESVAVQGLKWLRRKKRRRHLFYNTLGSYRFNVGCFSFASLTESIQLQSSRCTQWICLYLYSTVNHHIKQYDILYNNLERTRNYTLLRASSGWPLGPAWLQRGSCETDNATSLRLGPSLKSKLWIQKGGRDRAQSGCPSSFWYNSSYTH